MLRRSIPSLAVLVFISGSLSMSGGIAAESSASPPYHDGSDCSPAIIALPLPAGDTNGDVLSAASRFAVGYVADDAQHQQVAVWTRSEGRHWKVKDLGDFGLSDPFSALSATGVNAHGEVSIGVNAAVMRAWVYVDGAVHRLPDFAGGHNAYARAINDHGEIVGEALDQAGDDFAAVWPHWSSKPRRLAPIPGYDGSFAQGVNDRGVVSGGMFSLGSKPQLAVRWGPSGKPRVLRGLNGNAAAWATNDTGRTVGEAADQTTTYAATWSRSGRLHSLGLFRGDQFSRALDISTSGVVVGFEGVDPPPPAIPQRHILLWPGSGPVRSLLPLSGHWKDGAYSHTLDDHGDVFGASSAKAGALPQPTEWTCALAQSFVPRAGG
jgi:uncharacterized membrane protein